MSNPAFSPKRVDFEKEFYILKVKTKCLEEENKRLIEINDTLNNALNSSSKCLAALGEHMQALQKKNDELELLLYGANLTCNKIAELVGDKGQYRDLVEAVEMQLDSLKSKVREDWGYGGAQ